MKWRMADVLMRSFFEKTCTLKGHAMDQAGKTAGTKRVLRAVASATGILLCSNTGKE